MVYHIVSVHHTGLGRCFFLSQYCGRYLSSVMKNLAPQRPRSKSLDALESFVGMHYTKRMYGKITMLHFCSTIGTEFLLSVKQCHRTNLQKYLSICDLTTSLTE